MNLSRSAIAAIILTCWFDVQAATAVDDEILGLRLGDTFSIPQCKLWESPVRPNYVDPYPSYELPAKQPVLPCYTRPQVDPKPGTPLTMKGREIVGFQLQSDRIPQGVKDVYGIVSNGRLREVQVITAGMAWQADISALLAKKYGKPTSVRTERKSNAMGAVFDGIVAKWRLRDLTVEFDGIDDSISRGVIIIIKPSVQAVAEPSARRGF